MTEASPSVVAVILPAVVLALSVNCDLSNYYRISAEFPFAFSCFHFTNHNIVI